MLGKNAQEEKVNTLIGKGTRLEGKIVSSSSLRLDGELVGEIQTEGNITLGKEGNVHGNLYAKNITIEGRIEGNLCAKKHIYLSSSAQVLGDITAESLEMEKGATFNGKSTMGKEEVTDMMKKTESS
ncbi:cytoskeletal protein CcmA (bactofilin family) [Caldalkalibacillus uzonensis]|uniref:Cytoskeletal protein CcmA (Bactofilin family) n=1 Tax=Caldalkalibacillus uzonensis TaxID=353224 RepID=A0ABU0CTH1_9BACI|nr:polymer-forming cytoskeletal protein [Caldalkalibacillus uzonensis]MDQ0338805.1 cytoskeletal protein CcmA (bactofilin family) [Caldalkalibacillus uzonensis]